METTPETPTYTPPGEPQKWFHNGWFSRSFLLVASLFFFLPFIDIKCSGVKLASIKGSDLVFGNELKIDKEKLSERGIDTASVDEEEDQAVTGWNFATDSFEKGDNRNIAPNILAIGAFAAIIMAFLLSFFAKRMAVIVAGGFSLLALLVLFGIQFQLHNEVETKLGPFLFAAFTFEFTPYYWACLLFLALAAVFAFIRSSVLSRVP